MYGIKVFNNRDGGNLYRRQNSSVSSQVEIRNLC